MQSTPEDELQVHSLLMYEITCYLPNEMCNKIKNKFLSSLLITMAPTNSEGNCIAVTDPPHLGPPTPEFNSPWFKMYIYERIKSGPPSLLMPKGNISVGC